MGEILVGRASDAQIAAFVIGLRVKGESVAEVRALADAMIEAGLQVELPDSVRPVLDVVGTGGDHAHTVNISTMAALVAVGCGARVVKHGNRAATSATGTADVLEALGLTLEASPAEVARQLDDVGIAFCFAPVFHPAMRHAAAVRRELGIPTVFNILGPLTNPAGAEAALIGCADESRAPLMAEVLAERGVSALVVRGDDGLDEVSVSAPTSVWLAHHGAVRRLSLDAEALGIPRYDRSVLVGGERHRNADLLRKALGLTDAGDDAAAVTAIRDVVAVNAAAALVAWEVALGSPVPADDAALSDAVSVRLGDARAALLDGRAADVLERWCAPRPA
jgi:anthranilate phosphoribosyltransferase